MIIDFGSFSKYFGTTPKFWLGLQDDYDIIEEEKNSKEKEINNIKLFSSDAA
jgi:antitoxin HigA-1